MSMDLWKKTWRQVWHQGYAPFIPREGLLSLLAALKTDDLRLVQGATTSPPPLQCVQDWPVEACDCLGWTAWRGGEGEAKTVAEVEEVFANLCFDCDQAIGEPAACRYFLNWYDEAPRDEVFRELAVEAAKSLAGVAAKVRTEEMPAGVFADWLEDHGHLVEADLLRGEGGGQ